MAQRNDQMTLHGERPSGSGVVGKLVIPLFAGVAAGVATSYLQGWLPGPANFVANSGAVWVLIAFLLALPATTRLRDASLAAALALLGQVVGYYAVACPLRHIVTSNSERLLWTLAAVLIGPIVGALAWQSRCGRPRQRLVAASAVSGIVAGEGVYATLTLGHHVQGWLEIAVAGIAILLAVLRQRGASRFPAPTALAVAALVAALVATLVFGAYHV